MALLINVYATVRDLPPLSFPHEFVNGRDRSDPELPEHLNGFIGFIMDRGEREMTQSLYHVVRHIERVRHHLSVEVEDEHLDAFAEWGWRANAIGFLPNGVVCDPSGRTLVNPEDGTAEEGAEVPYPADARERKERTIAELRDRGIAVYDHLPPVLGAGEVVLRPADEVLRRAFSLAAVAVRGESLATNDEVAVADLAERMPLAFETPTPAEQAFLDDPSPEQHDVIQFTWRYEALRLLEWALGLEDELPWPTGICEAGLVVRALLAPPVEELRENASLRSPGEILDALDLHVRLHWAVRNASQAGEEPPASLEPGVIQERHHALNWLVRFEEADWDDVHTPT